MIYRPAHRHRAPTLPLKEGGEMEGAAVNNDVSGTRPGNASEAGRLGAARSPEGKHSPKIVDLQLTD